MIPLYKPHIPAAAAGEIGKILSSGQIAGDGNLPDFEGRLRGFLGVSHVAVTAEFSRTVEMALRMAGVGPGDEVLVSPLACLASTMPILQTGARPVWCDLDPATGGLDPAEISAAILDGELVTLRTRQGELLCDQPLGALERRLGPRFARVHRQALVNLDEVVRLEPLSTGGLVARLRDGGVVEVSRQAARRLRRSLALR